MANLKTRYMGIDLKNPVIAGASKLTADMKLLKELEKEGAAAVITASLFEEQINIQNERIEDIVMDKGGMHQTELNLPSMNIESIPEEHLRWVKLAVETLDIPVIASLNAVEEHIWVDWAQRLQSTGIAGLELNFYSVPTNIDISASDMEDAQIETVRKVAESVDIPVSVKLSPFYTNPLNVIARMDRAGAKGFILFNRFFQPDIDIEAKSSKYTFDLSSAQENRLPMRFAGLLHGRINGSICCSTGVHSAHDVAKMILAGADCVQMVSTLYMHKISWMASVIEKLGDWMDKAGFSDLEAMRGIMDRKNSPDPDAYERAQYVKILLDSEKSIGDYPLF